MCEYVKKQTIHEYIETNIKIDWISIENDININIRDRNKQYFL